MRPSGAPAALEDHEMCGLVADDLVAKLRGQIECESRDAHQPALGVTAAERALQAMTDDELQAFGKIRRVPCALTEYEDRSAGLEKVLLA
jgi:hypothetical protein